MILGYTVKLQNRIVTSVFSSSAEWRKREEKTNHLDELLCAGSQYKKTTQFSNHAVIKHQSYEIRSFKN